MQEIYDYKRFAVLYVDDEEKSLKLFARTFGETFRILTAANARDGFALLEAPKNEIGVLLTDQRMPGEKGVWLLERARQINPRLIRILVTAYSDLEAVIAAVNSGAIYKFITKPWDPAQIDQTLKRALEFYIVQRERDELLKEKMSVLHNMMIADRIISLGLLAAGLGHHIRNALVAVKTFLDLAPSKMQEEKLVSDGLRHPEFWKDYYENVQVQIQKISNMLKDLGAASEKPTLEFRDEVSVRDVVAQVLQQQGQSLAAKGLNFENLISEELPKLHVDLPRFQRLFELLVKDELATLPPGSKVTFSAQALTHSDGVAQVEICMHDNGPGLPKEALRLLFDPFLVRNESPMEYGINLMACYFIVHHHGGNIQAESDASAGTIFKLQFPTDPKQVVFSAEHPETLQKALLSQSLWEKLASSG